MTSYGPLHEADYWAPEEYEAFEKARKELFSMQQQRRFGAVISDDLIVDQEAKIAVLREAAIKAKAANMWAAIPAFLKRQAD